MKYTIEQVKQIFNENKCELLENEYKNNSTRMKYVCECKNQSVITLKSFLLGKRCMKCKGNEKYTLKYVNDFFIKHNCKLLEIEYKNTKTQMKYVCICGNISHTTFWSFKMGYIRCKKCSNKKRGETNLKKYGVEHVLQDTNILQKSQDTLFKNYGIINPMYSNVLKTKIKETNLERYGVEYCMQNKEIYKQSKNTNLEKYGVEYVLQNDNIKNKFKEKILNKTKKEKNNIQNKRKETCLYKYGVENSMQNKDIFIKNMKSQYRLKEYIMPSGKIITCQGYEPLALDILLKNFNEDAIITETEYIPRINYQLYGKNHYYFPDIFLPVDNKIIEVKSKYTYDTNLDKNLTKRMATIEAGYLFEFWIFDKDKKLVII